MTSACHLAWHLTVSSACFPFVPSSCALGSLSCSPCSLHGFAGHLIPGLLRSCFTVSCTPSCHPPTSGSCVGCWELPWRRCIIIWLFFLIFLSSLESFSSSLNATFAFTSTVFLLAWILWLFWNWNRTADPWDLPLKLRDWKGIWDAVRNVAKQLVSVWVPYKNCSFELI